MSEISINDILIDYDIYFHVESEDNLFVYYKNEKRYVKIIVMGIWQMPESVKLSLRDVYETIEFTDFKKNCLNTTEARNMKLYNILNCI